MSLQRVRSTGQFRTERVAVKDALRTVHAEQEAHELGHAKRVEECPEDCATCTRAATLQDLSDALAAALEALRAGELGRAEECIDMAGCEALELPEQDPAREAVFKAAAEIHRT